MAASGGHWKAGGFVAAGNSKRARIKPKMSQSELEAFAAKTYKPQKNYFTRNYVRKINAMSLDELRAYNAKEYSY